MENHHSMSTKHSQPPALPPQNLLILGAGRFGRIAAQRLHKRFPAASFLVVDESSEKIQALTAAVPLPAIVEDGITFLEHTRIAEDLWIIPAIPVHVGYLWLRSQLAHRGSVEHLPVPGEIDGQVPNPFRGAHGTLYASYATFRCPDSCSEPAEICTHTGKPRLGNLFQDLGTLAAVDFSPHVIRSHQLCPGVGGYTGRQLQDLLQEVHSRPGRHLIATSCRCHAVINALAWAQS